MKNIFFIMLFAVLLFTISCNAQTDNVKQNCILNKEKIGNPKSFSKNDLVVNVRYDVYFYKNDVYIIDDEIDALIIRQHQLINVSTVKNTGGWIQKDFVARFKKNGYRNIYFVTGINEIIK